MSERVKLLGYRTDVSELYAVSDAFIFPSFREGLSVSLMEAMVSGLPVVVSKIRGNTDLIDDNGGLLFNPHSVTECREAIEQVLLSNSDTMVAHNQNKIKKFDVKSVIKQINALYEEFE
jgi:glycosyltransferase involved in cell wall biosynthesis